MRLKKALTDSDLTEEEADLVVHLVGNFRNAFLELNPKGREIPEGVQNSIDIIDTLIPREKRR